MPHLSLPLFHSRINRKLKGSDTINDLLVINLDAFVNGSDSTRRCIASQVDAALQQHGFFYLSNHGVDSQVVQSCFEQVHETAHMALMLLKLSTEQAVF